MNQFNHSARVNWQQPELCFAPPLIFRNRIKSFAFLILLLFAVLVPAVAQEEEDCGCGEGGTVINAGSGTNITNYFSSTNVTNTCMKVTGILIVNDNFKITGGEIIMMPGSRIDIASGKTLTLVDVNDNEGVHGCGEMWTGFTLATNANADFTNCRIKDAISALRVSGSTCGLRLIENVFDRNYRSIYSGVHALQSGRVIVNNIIQNNEFTCEGYLLSPYAGQKSFAGIDLYYTTLGFGGNNTFSLLRNGFIAKAGGSIGIFNNQFENMISANPISVEKSVTPPLGTTFDGIAISVSRVVLQASFNTIDGARRAVYARDCYVNVQNNIIKNTVHGIIALNNISTAVISGNTQIDFQLYGIYFSNVSFCTTVIINDNTLNGISLASDFPTTQGVGVYAATLGWLCGSIPEIKRNEINVSRRFIGIRGGDLWQPSVLDDNTISYSDNYGISGITPIGIDLTYGQYLQVRSNTVTAEDEDAFEGLAFSFNVIENSLFCDNHALFSEDGFYFDVMCSSAQIPLNDMDNTGDALHYGPTALTGIQEHQGNEWLNSGGARRDFSDDLLLAENRYIVNCFDSPFWPPTFSPAQTSCQEISEHWFHGLDGTVLLECPALDERPESPTTFDQRVARADFAETEFGTMLTWETQRGLYARLVDDSGLLAQDAAVDSFYLAASTSNLDSFNDVRLAIRQMFTASSPFLSSSASFSQQMDSLTTKIADQDSAYVAAYGSLAQAAAQAYRDSLFERFGLVVAQLDSLTSVTRSAQQAQVAAIATLNSAIVPVGIIQENEQTVNQVFLEVYGGDSIWMDSANAALLLPIAQQCPWIGGAVVFRARTMYSLFYAETFDNETLCDPYRSQQRVVTPSKVSLKLSPNPASDQVVVTWGGTSESLATYIVLTDISGKALRRVSLNASDGSIIITAADLQPGLYLCQLFEGDRLVRTEKVAIIR